MSKKKNKTLLELMQSSERDNSFTSKTVEKPYKVAGKKYSTVSSNNWMNIRHSNAQTWQGEVGSADGFVLFSDPELSIRAFYRVLNSYIKQGADTIGKIITKYAPAGDNNNTNGYIRDVVAMIKLSKNDPKVGKDTKITTADYPYLAAAMMKIESGIEKDVPWFKAIYDKYF